MFINPSPSTPSSPPAKQYQIKSYHIVLPSSELGKVYTELDLSFKCRQKLRLNDCRLKEPTLLPLVSGQMSSYTKDRIWSHRRLFCRSGWESQGPLKFHVCPTRQLSPARLHNVTATGRLEIPPKSINTGSEREGTYNKSLRRHEIGSVSAPVGLSGS